MEEHVIGGRLLKGDGKTDLAIGDLHGKVTMVFPQPRDWVALDPSTAVEIAGALVDAAQKLGARVTVKTEPVKVPKAIRQRMEARCLMILTNKREANESNPVLAARVVDTLLNLLDL